MRVLGSTLLVLGVAAGCAGPERLARVHHGSRLLVAAEGELRLHTPATGTRITEFAASRAPGALTVTRDGRWGVAAGPEGNELMVHDLAQHSLRRRVPLPARPLGVATLGRRQDAVAALASGEIARLHLTAGEVRGRYASGLTAPRALVADRAGERVWVAGDDTLVALDLDAPGDRAPSRSAPARWTWCDDPEPTSCGSPAGTRASWRWWTVRA